MGAAAKHESTAVATQKPQSFAVTLMEQHGDRIEAFLPEGVSLQRVAAALRLEAMKNPMIADCTPASLIQSIGRIMQWQLEIGVTAYIVPFKDRKKGVTEAVAVMGYTGMAELMVASGSVRAVQAKAVHEHDFFEYEQGLDAKLRHIPDSHPATRGPLVGAYCILRVRGGDVFDYMGIDEIEAIRAKSKQWGPDKVRECPDWYAMKTIVRRTSKLVPKNPRLARVMAAIDEDLDLDGQQQVASVPAPRTLPDRREPHRPKALVQGGYDELPEPPARHAEDVSLTAEDTEERGELALGDDLAPVRPRRRDAMRET